MDNARFNGKINGLPLSEVMAKLREPFAKEYFKDDGFGHSYLPKPVIKERLDSIVGIFNYDFITRKPEYQEIAGKLHVVVNCTLILYGDNGETLIKRSLNGDAAIIISSNSGSAVNVSNDIEAATADGFKRCCKWLGIGESQLKNKKGNQADKNSTKSNSVSEPESKTYTITLKGSFSTMGKNALSAKCLIDGKEEAQFVLWEDAQQLILDNTGFKTITDYTSAAVPGTKLTFIGYEKFYKGKKQVIMTGFAN